MFKWPPCIHMTGYAWPRDYVGNLQSPWKTSNILGTVLTVTPPRCESDVFTHIVLNPDWVLLILPHCRWYSHNVVDTPTMSLILPHCRWYSHTVVDTPTLSLILPHCRWYSHNVVETITQTYSSAGSLLKQRRSHRSHRSHVQHIVSRTDFPREARSLSRVELVPELENQNDDK